MCRSFRHSNNQAEFVKLTTAAVNRKKRLVFADFGNNIYAVSDNFENHLKKGDYNYEKLLNPQKQRLT